MNVNEIEAPDCLACGCSDVNLLGVLGNLAHFRCRACGADNSVKVEKGPSIPLVHSNGTGKADLLGQVREACDALNTAEEALRAMAPHARDYYPRGDSAYTKARDEHQARMKAIAAVKEELIAVYRGIQKQGRAV